MIMIYIPIWLDLLFPSKLEECLQNFYLHSNMVRFIMKKVQAIVEAKREFTFQYG